jgi:hypothetical protein
MLLPRLILLVSAASPMRGLPLGATACTSPRDCSMAGTCVGGSCVCTAGFVGPTCGTLSLESFRCGAGGLCLSNGSTTWGGSVLQADDGRFHMYAAMMTENKTLQAWLTNSVVLHAVAAVAEGPYLPSDTALAPRAVPHFDSVMIHNPDAQRAPDGTYLIFYDGSSAPPTPYHPTVAENQWQQEQQQQQHHHQGDAGGSSATHPYNPIILRQKIGLATSKSPYGPWTRQDVPVLEPTGIDGTWDQLFVTNPAP